MKSIPFLVTYLQFISIIQYSSFDYFFFISKIKSIFIIWLLNAWSAGENSLSRGGFGSGRYSSVTNSSFSSSIFLSTFFWFHQCLILQREFLRKNAGQFNHLVHFKVRYTFKKGVEILKIKVLTSTSNSAGPLILMILRRERYSKFSIPVKKVGEHVHEDGWKAFQDVDKDTEKKEDIG